MDKVISLETSKRLAPFLKDIKTEYFWFYHVDWEYELMKCSDMQDTYNFGADEKTLTLEEAIEFLPIEIKWYTILLWKSGQEHILTKTINNKYYTVWYFIKWNNWLKILERVTWKTLLEAVEKMIIYLLENNLLKNEI